MATCAQSACPVATCRHEANSPTSLFVRRGAWPGDRHLVVYREALRLLLRRRAFGPIAAHIMARFAIGAPPNRRSAHCPSQVAAYGLASRASRRRSIRSLRQRARRKVLGDARPET